jgi:UDP-N-acetyl-D-mannosaminuronic acid dehydrogenase
LAIEPNIKKLPQTIPDNVQLTDTEAGLEADIYVVLVKHKEFKSLHLNTEKVINTCGL